MAAAQPSQGTLRKLDPDVIRQIAAGEVVISPSHALKELIENSLDAGAKSIQVTVRDAGLKQLTVQDDGKGISRDDLPRLCQRHTTSKLQKVEDLKSIATFGFRGEALASLAICGSVTIQSMQENADCAYKCRFQNGALVAEGGSRDPVPCAGKQGTIVTVENMFFNDDVRLSALAGKPDTLTAVEKVAKAYALANPTVAFTLKKASTAVALLLSRPSAAGDLETIVSQVYGASLGEKLAVMKINSPRPNFTAEMRFSPPTGAWQTRMKKMELWIFVNKRWVQHDKIKKTITGAYKTIFGDKGAPFVFVSLTMPPADVDVNVHPTKEKVALLEEKTIVAILKDKFEASLRELKGDMPVSPLSPAPSSASPAKGSGKRALDKDTPKKPPTPKKSAAVSYPSMDAFLKKPPPAAAAIANSPPPPARVANDDVMFIDSDFMPAPGLAGTNSAAGPVPAPAAPPSSSLVPHQAQAPLAAAPTAFVQSRLLHAAPQASKPPPRAPASTLLPSTRPAPSNDQPQGFVSASSMLSPRPPPAPASAATSAATSLPLAPPAPPPTLPVSVNDQVLADVVATGVDPVDGIEETVGALAAGSQSKKKSQESGPHSHSKKRYTTSRLKSVAEEIAALKANEHAGARALLQQGRLVSAVDCTLLIQYNNKIWRLDGERACASLVAQYVWRKWGQFEKFTFSPPLPLRELLLLGIQHLNLDTTKLHGRTPDAAAEDFATLLTERASMFHEYWGIVIESELLHSLPVIVDGLVPSQAMLPTFLVRLANLEMTNERACFTEVVAALQELYTVQRGQQRLWELSLNEDDDDDLPSTQQKTPPPKAMLEANKAAEQLFFYWKSEGDDPLQRAMDAAERKRAHVFAKPYNQTNRYYLVQEAELFYTKYFLSHPEASRTFEQVVLPDAPVKFFMEISYARSPLNPQNLEAMMHMLRAEVLQQWQRDTGKKGAEDAWIEFDHSTLVLVSRSLYNYKMSFKNIEHLYTFARRLQSVLESKKNSSEAGSLLFVQREKKKKWREELIFNAEEYVPKRALLLPWCCPLSGGAISQPAPHAGAAPVTTTPDRITFQRCLVCVNAPPPFTYADTDLLPRLSPGRSKTTRQRPPLSSAHGSIDFALEQLVWPALRCGFYAPVEWETDGSIACLDPSLV